MRPINWKVAGKVVAFLGTSGFLAALASGANWYVNTRFEHKKLEYQGEQIEAQKRTIGIQERDIARLRKRERDMNDYDSLKREVTIARANVSREAANQRVILQVASYAKQLAFTRRNAIEFSIELTRSIIPSEHAALEEGSRQNLRDMDSLERSLNTLRTQLQCLD